MAKKWQLVCSNTECWGVDNKPRFRMGNGPLIVDEDKQCIDECTTYPAECFMCDYCETTAIAGDEE